MLYERLSAALNEAIQARDDVAVATIRLVNAAIKDREIANRIRGVTDDLDEVQVMAVLEAMVEQRNESIAIYQREARDDLILKETQELEVIRRFLPRRLGDAETAEAVREVMAEIDARGIRDMGRTLATLRTRFAGQLDIGKAGALVRQALG